MNKPLKAVAKVLLGWLLSCLKKKAGEATKDTAPKKKASSQQAYSDNRTHLKI